MMDYVPSSNSNNVAEMSENSLGNGRFSNRAARFYWADDEPSPQRAYSIQKLHRLSSDSNFEESPLVIASISAGVIGVAIIIIILVGIWIRSRLFSEEEGRIGSGENPNNISVRSSLSTLEEESYAVCMEMDGTVLGSMHNAAERNECENNDTAIDIEPHETNQNDKASIREPETTQDIQTQSSIPITESSGNNKTDDELSTVK